MATYRAVEQIQQDASTKLKVVIVGAGLGGLGAAIAILLAGHEVTVLESASKIGEIGAGIQVLPNSSRVLFAWGLKDCLEPYATHPRQCNYYGWKGNRLATMDFHAYGQAANGVFWDFHRVNLHRALIDRAFELGAHLETNARATKVTTEEKGGFSTSTVHLQDGRSFTGDLVIGADGINSQMREELVGHEDPPTPTGDLAYRLLLDTKDMMADPELREMVDNPQVNYWLGPDAHAVNYILRGGKQLNMVLLVPDNLPPGEHATTGTGTSDEMRALYEGWDPRINKLLSLCTSSEVLKWRLCIRPGLDPTWTHPSASFTLTGDAVHATLPYLASGAGMALEDAGVLGLCLARIKDKSIQSKKLALDVYEACRRVRTEKVVQRGTYNQYMYHMQDGPDQIERDQKLAHFEEVDKKWISDAEAAGTAPVLPISDETGEDPFPWRYNGVARWLLTYDMWKDVEVTWASLDVQAQAIQASL
ncbi:salicylate hydroxylase [Ophiostoma piceae UAMH 11346]|uniref:Salicylate hydroxylase n=1 Tax=Ophiostoma piceae (strain UAMH 11346) TaxID=1262450 RepID=S3CTW9_OPHP1|nr:salicylate hydroxylase [Ophiostoma piceae UAMH 11346]